MTDIIMTESMISPMLQMQTGNPDSYRHLEPEIVDSSEFIEYLGRTKDGLRLEVEHKSPEKLKIIGKNGVDIVMHYWDLEFDTPDADSIRAELAVLFDAVAS